MIHSSFSRGMDSFYRTLPYRGRRALRAAINPSRYRRLQRMRRNDRNGYSLDGFDQHACIFVHIPKCAGISIASSLFGNLAGGHYTIRRYQLIFSEAEFERYFKFTFVRNPWDRLVSAFHFLKKGGVNQRDAQWAARQLGEFADFGDFVRRWINSRNIYRGIHFIPQFEFLRVAGSAPKVDFVGRFENLEEDFQHIAQTIGAESVLAKRNSRSVGRDFREYYEDDTVQIVADAFATDIELFGYTFD